MPRYPSIAGWALLSLGLLVGCDRNEVQVYRIAKEQSVPAGQGGMPAGHPPTSTPGATVPQLKWAALPPGWEQVSPGQMRVASFKVQEETKQADLGVVPLPGLAGNDLESVNRWRGSVGLPEVTEAELPKLAQKIEIAGAQGDLYEQAGENPGSGEKTRVLSAILRRDGVAWFFKFTGDDELVAKHKPAFVSLLKSLTFVAGSPTMGAETAGASLPPSHPPIGGGDAGGQAASASG